MKLNGTKLISASVLSLITTITQAETIEAPALTTFTAGTPAKAAEVNANFAGLKTYGNALNDVVNAQAALIEELEAKVAALQEVDNGDEYNIEVKGDGVVIGYTNKVIFATDKPFIALKTNFGMASIKGGYDGNFELYEYDELREERGSQSQIYFTDSECLQPVRVLSSSEYGQPLMFTKQANITNKNTIVVAEQGAYLQEKGTTFYRTNESSVLYSNWDSCQEFLHIYDNSIVIPLTILDVNTHGLKKSYSSIQIDGYVTN